MFDWGVPKHRIRMVLQWWPLNVHTCIFDTDPSLTFTFSLFFLSFVCCCVWIKMCMIKSY